MIAIPLIYFICIFTYFYLKGKSWGLDLAATSLLIAISISAILIDINDLYGDYGINYDNITLPTIILFCIQWTIILIPIHILSRLPIEKHVPEKNTLLYIFFIFIAGSSIIMILSSGSAIKEALIMDMADVRDQHYQDMAGGSSGEANYFMLIPQILISNPFPTLALFFWFYMKAFMKCSLFLRAGMITASIVQAILAIIMAGRAAMIYWAFDFFLIYSLFYRYLPKRLKRTITSTALIMGAIASILFVSITIARVDGSTRNKDAMASLYGYAGQHIDNFCTMFEKGGDAPFQTARIFPLYTKITTGEAFSLHDHYEKIVTQVNAIVNVFDTFGAELYLDLGWFGYIAFFILVLLFTIIIKYNWEVIEFRHIFILVIVISFFTRSLFAWPFTGHYTTFALIIVLSNCYLFKYIFRI